MRSNEQSREGRFSRSSLSRYFWTHCPTTPSQPPGLLSSQAQPIHTSGSQESSPSNHYSSTLRPSLSPQARCPRSMNREPPNFSYRSPLKETTISPENFWEDTLSSSPFLHSTSS